jgi:KUP system potassium uptake protein
MIVFYFKDSAKMEAAYGLAITITMLMTTFLLAYFLRSKLGWNRVAVGGLLLVFGAVEISFFIANLMKFKEGGYITVLVGSVFFLVMYTSFYGRKINNRYTKFSHLGKFTDKIVQLSNDKTMPKFATHLIYLTKADHRDQVEQIIINSIFGKRPKRADVYWFFHINRTNKPYTLNYEVSELVDDKVIKIVLNIGFRIQPRTELYFKQIIHELIEKKELNLHLKYNGSNKYNNSVDYKFVVIEKYMSIENEFTFHERFVLNTYFSLKKYVQHDEQAFGLDRTSVQVEEVPLVYHRPAGVELERIN